MAQSARPGAALRVPSQRQGETNKAKSLQEASGERMPMTSINPETMLTGARIMAIVPTTDLSRAKAFYGQTLGLVEANVSTPGPQVIYRCGGNTLLEVYERPAAGEAQHTLASWEVSDVKAAVDQLRSCGVRFEEYDLPGVKTEDGISASGDLREAWFRDPDGNILRIHSHLQK
jgi:catechol 2,3-dioxygenase-like lactoylglutathione lyase family enzyme